MDAETKDLKLTDISKTPQKAELMVSFAEEQIENGYHNQRILGSRRIRVSLIELYKIQTIQKRFLENKCYINRQLWSKCPTLARFSSCSRKTEEKITECGQELLCGSLESSRKVSAEVKTTLQTGGTNMSFEEKNLI